MWSSWLSFYNINSIFRSVAESVVFPPSRVCCTGRKAARIPHTALHSAEWSNTHSLLSQIIIRAPALLLHTLSPAVLNIKDFQLSTGWVLKRPAIKTQTYSNMHMSFSSTMYKLGSKPSLLECQFSLSAPSASYDGWDHIRSYFSSFFPHAYTCIILHSHFLSFPLCPSLCSDSHRAHSKAHAFSCMSAS